LLAVSHVEQNSKLRSIMPQDDKLTSWPQPPGKPSSTEEALRIVEEYADDLRKILRKLRKLFN